MTTDVKYAIDDDGDSWVIADENGVWISEALYHAYKRLGIPIPPSDTFSTDGLEDLCGPITYFTEEQWERSHDSR